MDERPDHVDILISGGGVAGLTAAAAFGTTGFRVLCVDPAPPVTKAAGPGADLRTTAFLQPARDTLAAAGLWDRLAPHAAPLATMRIVDAGGEAAEARIARDFDAADVSDAPFGWNLPNWLLRREMVARLAELPNVDFRPGTGFRGMVARTREVLVHITDGSRPRARLVIGADGRASPVRDAAGIGVSVHRYGQQALTFAVTHPEPHRNVSVEVHRSGGPFTLVPLPDRDGRPCSAVVWMMPGAEARRLHALPEDAFEAAATDRSAAHFGPLTLASPRGLWPIVAQRATAMTARRTALIAEAAHVVPPIGAQGLNMSLADIAALLDLATATPDALGSDAMLAAYARAREPEVALRVRGVDALNRASMADRPLLRDLRALGIGALHGLPPLRRALMQLGMGTGS